MANIRTLDMKFLDDLFEMNAGYVLDFSDRTMSSFFAEELNVDIGDPSYREQGTSKARRLRCYLNKVDLPASVQALKALWAYRESYRSRQGRKDWVENAEGRFLSLLGRMQGMPDAGSAEPPKLAFQRPKILALKRELTDMWGMDPHARGYAFEAWLREAFNLYGLGAREPFRNKGEQIDGSFVLLGETYLLEAKWQSALTPAVDLHALEGKLAQKAAWARGLFVSYTGFSEEGLHAFGRGKRVICMDGGDFHDALERELPLDHVLAHKARAAAETGLPFQRVRDLFAR